MKTLILCPGVACKLLKPVKRVVTASYIYTSYPPAAWPAWRHNVFYSSIDIAVGSNFAPASICEYGTVADYDSGHAIDSSPGFILQFDPGYISNFGPGFESRFCATPRSQFSTGYPIVWPKAGQMLVSKLNIDYILLGDSVAFNE
ncbi:hypothetical protein EVAR_88054_1 [Eumeta japonica]|uniref:Uncharacterized protein n=1 Tax=Eumeta variegata TaxID=151549 RepID=A0A4C1VCW2_EUMVA|nr:hypothetical protein EVAR_88054_1 [Eumeta japonica]